MRKSVSLLFFLSILSISVDAWAQDSATLQSFDSGTSSLVEGDFLGALNFFEDAERGDWHSTGLYYNMGLAHYRLDRLGPAIRYLEKAIEMDPDNEKALHSLAVARSHRIDNFSQLPTPLWRRAHAVAVRGFPVVPSFWIGLLGSGVLSVLVLLRILQNYDGAWWRRGRLVAAIIGGIFLVHAFASAAWPPFDQRAVVLADEVALLEQADPEAIEVVLVHEGMVVVLGTSVEDWTFVQIPNGSRGWVPSAVLGDI